MMKKMLKNWDKAFPGRLETIFSSLQSVAPSQLADTQLFDFIGLNLDQRADVSVNSAMMEADSYGLDVLQR